MLIQDVQHFHLSYLFYMTFIFYKFRGKLLLLFYIFCSFLYLLVKEDKLGLIRFPDLKEISCNRRNCVLLFALFRSISQVMVVILHKRMQKKIEFFATVLHCVILQVQKTIMFGRKRKLIQFKFFCDINTFRRGYPFFLLGIRVTSVQQTVS